MTADELHEASERLFEAVRNLPLGVALFDREMRYVAANERWLPAHGEHAARELVGRSHYDVFPTQPAAWRDAHRRCLAGALESRDFDTLRDASGNEHHLRWVAKPFRRADGSIGGLLVCVEDITEHVATRRRLEERESLIRQLFERSPIGLNLCTMEGLWVESNPAFLDLLGYSREEADGGLTYWQLTPRRYDADEAVQLESLARSRRYGPYEKEFIHKDGRLVPVRLNGFVVERDGVEYIWSLIEDLTARRELEAKLEEERLKAIQASRLALLGEMAAGVAHEINNPLGIVAGYAYALRQAIADGDRALIDEALDAITIATERAGRIVRGLRKISRQGPQPEQSSSVATFIDDALDLCRHRIRTHGVELSTDVATRRVVRGHGVELSQVIVNLLNNAFDAARVGAPPRWVRLAARDDGADRVRIDVENSGPPIEPCVAVSMFRAFFTTKPPGEGTGLGLSISRSIVEAHGGTLVHDADAPSTRFVVRLEVAA